MDMDRMPVAISSLLNAATDVAIIVTDTNGKVALFNLGAEALLGYRAEEVVGFRALSDFHRADEVISLASTPSQLDDLNQQAFHALIGQVKEGKSVKWDRACVRKDGMVLHISIALSPIYDEQKILIGFLGIVNDITSQVLAAAQALENAQQLIQIQQIARLSTWEYTLATGEFSISQQFFRHFEITHKQNHSGLATDAARMLRYVYPDDRKYVKRGLKNALANQENFHIEHRICTQKDNIFYIKSIGCWWRNAQGKAVKLLGILQDITEQKLEEQELAEARSDAERAVEAKQQFLSTISHEIRTPLNAVLGISHLLLQEKPRENQLDKLKMLLFSSENLLSLVNDVLDYSKMEAGKTVFEEIIFDVNELLVNIKQSFGYTATNKHIKINTRLDSMLPNKLVGDPYRLAQVMNNLLSNAIKFTETGSITMEVMIAGEDTDGITLDFAVTDTGIGIPEDRLDFIFESFVQATSSTTRTFGGTGLGLAITKRLLELQGSRIYVNSTLGQGSRFFFSLKFKKQPQIQVTPKAAKPLSRAKVLLVEDDDINRMIVSKLLNNLDIQPDCATNGLEALQKVQANEYQLVLMDLQLPEMDGCEATLAIRALAEKRYQQLPIIALTATDIPELMHKTAHVGITDFIAKPFTQDALLRIIQKYTDRKATQAPPPTLKRTSSQLKITDYTEGRLGLDKESEQLKRLHACDKWLRDLKKKYHLALISRDELCLDSAIQTLQSTFSSFDLPDLLFVLQQGKNLLVDRHTSQEQLFQSVNRVHFQCDLIIDQLYKSQQTLALKIA